MQRRGNDRRVFIGSIRAVGARVNGGMQRMTTVFKVQHEVNPRVTLENTGFADAAQVH